MTQSEVSEETIEALREAGWYEGRKIDITENVKFLESLGVEVIESAKRFMEEFGGLCINDGYTLNTYTEQVIINGAYSNIDEYINEKHTIVGEVNEEYDLFITESGKMFINIGWKGDSIWEGLENVITTKKYKKWGYYTLRDELSEREIDFAYSLKKRIEDAYHYGNRNFYKILSDTDDIKTIKKIGKYLPYFTLEKFYAILNEIKLEADFLYGKVVDEIISSEFIQEFINDKYKKFSYDTAYEFEKYGWSKGRKIDISENVKFLEEQGFEVVEIAKKFLEEFGNLDLEDMSVRWEHERDSLSTNIKNYPNVNHNSIRSHIQEKYTFIGMINQKKEPIYITESGKLYSSEGWLGDNLIEGFENIITMRYMIPWKYYEFNDYNLSKQEMSLLIQLEKKVLNMDSRNFDYYISFYLPHRDFVINIKKIIPYLNKSDFENFKTKLEEFDLEQETTIFKDDLEKIYVTMSERIEKTEYSKVQVQKKTNLEKTIETLEEFGWYKERKIEITETVKFLKEKGFEVTEKAKLFLEEYGELNIVAKREKIDCTYYEKISTEFKKLSKITVDNSLSEHIQEKYTPIGVFRNDIPIYITESGKIFTNKGWRGDFHLEGLTNLITTEYEVHWTWYEANTDGKFTNTELAFLVQLYETVGNKCLINKLYDWLDNDDCVRIIKKMAKHLESDKLTDLKIDLIEIRTKKPKYRNIIDEIFPFLKNLKK